MDFRCKICAGSLSIDHKTRIATCNYCGTKQILPLFGDDSSKVLYDRGNQYLLHNEYDKAESVFSRLLSVNPNDGEIYWDLVLCKYGVTYAKDPKTQKYVPTCNRTQTDSVLKDPNYLKAMELSPKEKGDLYRADALVIDKIQHGILEVSRKEKPFDVFISYKETDESGNRTADSIEAQKLYTKLTELGYKVFFSRVTLESKIGEEYEPYIYAALSSSKVMITVCSSGENMQSAWVKNEWSRFLTLRRSDTSKTLIPVYFDMDANELPEEFLLLPALDLNAPDFEQELIRGVKKLIPTPIILKERRKKAGKALLIASIIAVAIGLPLYFILTKPARIAAKNAEQYEQAIMLFDSGEYDSAKEIFDSLDEYEDAMVMAEKCSYYPAYDDAMQLYYERNYPEAAWAFSEIGDYDDVNEMADKCKSLWRENVSTVARPADNNYIDSRGAYFITANGTVKTFDNDPGDRNVMILSIKEDGKMVEAPLELNEHGKTVSISANDYALYALYEDGVVCNSAVCNGMDHDWSNAIQISDQFESTSVALLDDGKMVYGNTEEDRYGFGDTDKWIEEIQNWSGIIQIDWYLSRESGGLIEGVLIGLDSGGDVHVVSNHDEDGFVSDQVYQDWETAIEFMKDLSDIKEIHVNSDGYVKTVSGVTQIGTTATFDTGIPVLCVAALDKDNVMHIFNRDGESTQNVGEIKGFWVGTGGIIYVIDSRNNLVRLDNNKTILEGVVYVNDGYCVSQSGTIYDMEGNTTNEKTKVKDVWLER